MLNRKFETLAKIFIEYKEKLSIDRNMRNMNMSYCAGNMVIREMEKLGIVKINKVGRENQVKFTTKGRVLRDKFRDIVEIIGSD